MECDTPCYLLKSEVSAEMEWQQKSVIYTAVTEEQTLTLVNNIITKWVSGCIHPVAPMKILSLMLILPLGGPSGLKCVTTHLVVWI